MSKCPDCVENVTPTTIQVAMATYSPKNIVLKFFLSNYVLASNRPTAVTKQFCDLYV